MSVDEGAERATDFLRRARDATAAASAADTVSEAEAMIRVARIWLDLANDAMGGVLAVGAAAAND
jgi:hypothetical protein